MPITVSDLRYAARVALKSPWLTLLTVGVLAAGLATSIYTFAIINTMIYKDLPLVEGQSIVHVGGEKDGRPVGLNAHDLAAIRGDLRGLGEIGIYRTASSLFGDQESRRSVVLTQTEWTIFAFTRTPPLLGRTFVRGDSEAGTERVAVLSYHMWQSVFIGDVSAVGQFVTVNGEAARIVGIMPQGYAFPLNTDVWVPLSNQDINPTSYAQESFDAYARLSPAASAHSATAELSRLLRGVQQERRRSDNESAVVAVVSTFQEALWGDWGPRVFVVVNALAFFILVLACVNVGTLLLARTNERIKEISVRLALGAGRARLIVQMTLQNVIISVVGCVLAVVLAAWGLAATDRFLRPVLLNEMPFWWIWRLDGDVVGAAVLCLLLTIAMVSVLPFYTVRTVSPNAVLKDGTHSGAGRSAGRVSRALVTLQVALVSAVMLSGGTAAVIAYRMAHFDPRIDTAGIFTTPGIEPGEVNGSQEDRWSFYERLMTALRNDGQVQAARITQQIGETEFTVEDVEYPSRDYPRAHLWTVLETDVPVERTLLEGRRFDSRDTAAGLMTAIISESAARKYWPDESALGRRIEIDGVGSGIRTIVGVVRDPVSDPIPETDSVVAVYVPLQQSTAARRASVMIRYSGTDDGARNAMYSALESAGASRTVGRVNRYDDELETMTRFATTLTALFAGCGAFAVLLAMVGIYGLSSNSVIQRTQEIGLRRAMGATNASIIRLFLARGSAQLAVGLGISGVLSLVLLLLMAQLARLALPLLILMGVIVIVAVSALVLVSIYLGLRRAIRPEPSEALRWA